MTQRNYLQHGSRHRPTGTDPIPGQLCSAYAQQNIGTTTTISSGTSSAITWDNIAVDSSGVFTAGSGGSPWTVTDEGIYQILLAVTPNGFWPASGTGTFQLVPDGLSEFFIKEGGVFTADGSAETVILTGFVITGGSAPPATVQLRLRNDTSASITIVGPNVIAVMNRLGPQLP